MTKFEKELREMMKKHGVVMKEHENYDCDDHYCDSEYSFIGEGIDIPVSDLA